MIFVSLRRRCFVDSFRLKFVSFCLTRILFNPLPPLPPPLLPSNAHSVVPVRQLLFLMTEERDSSSATEGFSVCRDVQVVFYNDVLHYQLTYPINLIHTSVCTPLCLRAPFINSPHVVSPSVSTVFSHVRFTDKHTVTEMRMNRHSSSRTPSIFDLTASHRSCLRLCRNICATWISSGLRISLQDLKEFRCALPTCLSRIL